jgi:hypothetical protein
LQRQSNRALLLILVVIVIVAGVPRIRRFVLLHKSVPKPAAQRAADIIFFYSANCSKCKKVKPQITRLEMDRPDLKVLWIETTRPETKMLFESWQNRYEIPREHWGDVPALFVESTLKAYTGVPEIEKAVQKLIEERKKTQTEREGRKRSGQQSSLLLPALAPAQNGSGPPV